MRKTAIILLMAWLAATVCVAGADDDVETRVWKPQVRRLHPERERARAVKLLKEQMSRRAQEKEDPWDTSGDMWGTVDLPPAALRDSTAAPGHRIDGGHTAQPNHRLTWRDEPVTATVDQLMPYFVITDDGECRSKYVTTDDASSEVYFAFQLNDSVTGPLRLCVRYSAASPVSFDQLTFVIDDFDYVFYPSDPQSRTVGGGRYVASCDDELRPAYRDLVYALAHGKWVMMKCQGQGVSRVKMLTDGQRQDFANTLSLYLLMGGEI